MISPEGVTLGRGGGGEATSGIGWPGIDVGGRGTGSDAIGAGLGEAVSGETPAAAGDSINGGNGDGSVEPAVTAPLTVVSAAEAAGGFPDG